MSVAFKTEGEAVEQEFYDFVGKKLTNSQFGANEVIAQKSLKQKRELYEILTSQLQPRDKV